MRIITTVGTSLIDNFANKVDCTSLRDEKFADSKFELGNEFFQNHIKPKEEDLFNLVGDKDASAELATLSKIDPAGKAGIYLLCTETVTSYMCGRVLQKFLGDRAQLQFIKGLQVNDANQFKTSGFLNLIEAIKNICAPGDDSIAFNISGGYKALIPAVTLIAQLEKASLYYIFEESDELIEISNLPVSFDWEIIESYGALLHNSTRRQNASEEDIKALRNLKLMKDENNELTIIGTLLSVYSNKASPFTETIFGYLIEYKVYEYYSSIYSPEKVQHSVGFEGMGTEDIDILIIRDKDIFISVEIKPATLLANDTSLERVTDNFIRRVGAAREKYGKPVEVWLVLYSYSEIKSDVRAMTEREKSRAKIAGQEMRKSIDAELTFRIQHFFIQRNKLGQDRHIYQKFMRSKLKPESIKEIFQF